MDNVTEAKVGAAMEEQLCAANRIEINPFSQMDPAKLPLDTGSSFQVWRKPYYSSHGDAGASSYAPESYLQLENNPINGDGSTFGACANDNADQIHVIQAAKPDLDHNFNADMDPKRLKRIMSNRISAKKSRVKKSHYVADLESKTQFLEAHINILRPQVVGYTNQNQLLIMEQHNLKRKMAALEKQKILQEAEIEKNEAELHTLRELQNKQHEQLRAKASMFTWEAGLQLMPNSNSNHSNLGDMVYKNSVQGAQNEKETSTMKIDVQTKQDQMRMPAGWETGQSSTISSGLKISERDKKKLSLSENHLLGMNNMPSSNALNSDLRYRLI